MRLRLDDDLMRAVDGRDARVALEHAFARRHLGAVIVGPIALAERALRPAAIGRVGRQPGADLRRVLL